MHANIPPVPAPNPQRNEDISIEQHSEEEKLAEDMMNTRGAPMNQRMNRQKVSQAPIERRLPFIDDCSKSKISKISIDTKPSKDVSYRICYLLFLSFPHPINVTALCTKYFNFFREPLEVRDQQLDALIDSIPSIVKAQNPFAWVYDVDVEESFTLKLKSVLAFIQGFDRETQYGLIREKVHGHMEAYHPFGLAIGTESKEWKNMFRYWIGFRFEQLDDTLRQMIKSQMFDQINDGDNNVIVMKGRQRPQLPLSERHRIFCLSCRNMILVLLSDRNGWTRKEFMEMHERIFGVALDFTSAFVQREVDRLIDRELFKKDASFALTEDSRNVCLH